jgi:hypothetical protein
MDLNLSTPYGVVRGKWYSQTAAPDSTVTKPYLYYPKSDAAYARNTNGLSSGHQSAGGTVNGSICKPW